MDIQIDIAPSLSDLASLLILSLLEVQLYSRPSAIRLPTLARTVSIRGIPIIPNIRQNSRPPERMFSAGQSLQRFIPKVSVAKFP